MMVFFEQGWGKFGFGKNVFEHESPTLKNYSNSTFLC